MTGRPVVNVQRRKLDLEVYDDQVPPHCLYFKNGYLHCGELRVVDIKRELESHLMKTQQHISATPFYLYSNAQIVRNTTSYTSALDDLGKPYILGYAMKANYNAQILSILRKQSSAISLILVSGNELLLAVTAGFDPSKLIFNGNGKTTWEIKLAVDYGCLINVDSEFGLRHTINVCRDLNQTARLLIRINPDIDPDVHPYISTGLAETKFGVELDGVGELLEMIRSEPFLKLVGLHCHLGSTIDSTRVFKECVKKMLNLTKKIRHMGFTDIDYVNIGGGLGINYTKYAHRTMAKRDHSCVWSDMRVEELHRIAKENLPECPKTAKNLIQLIQKLTDKTLSIAEYAQEAERMLRDYPKLLRAFNHILPEEHQIMILMPSPSDLIESIKHLLQEVNDITLILEPGRSLVADAGCLVTEVIGCKKNGNKNFIVVDGAMTEVIRPSLYGAYHHVELAEPTEDTEPRVFDVVGPVCESGDFLAKGRLLLKPHEGCTLVVFDTGAYCSSMGSNYNMRVRPAEVMVEDGKWRIIRDPENFIDLLKQSGLK